MNLEQELVNASIRGDLEAIKKCVASGADIHVEEDFALRIASYNSHLEVVKYLIECGADIHALEDLALRYASQYGHLEVVKYLCSVYLERYGAAWCLTSDIQELRRHALEGVNE